MEMEAANVPNRRPVASMAPIGSRFRSSPGRSWKGVWSKFWCFGIEKHGKQIVPTSQLDESTGAPREWAAAGPGQAGGLSLAPPSSPASIVNSSIQSPVSFTLPLSASENMFSPGPAKLMFTIGPYAHETQLVSPPVFSTFTTEPSTAPLTPHPESAHLTTPSSPDVPFAQLLASSLEAKAKVRKSTVSLSPLSLASPGDVATGDPKALFSYQGFPSGQLISPPSGYSDSGTSSPFSDIDFSARFSASMQGSLFRNSASFKSEFLRQKGGNHFADSALTKHEKWRDRFSSVDMVDQNVSSKSPQSVWHALTYEHEVGCGIHRHAKGGMMEGKVTMEAEKLVPSMISNSDEKREDVTDQASSVTNSDSESSSSALQFSQDVKRELVTVTDAQGFSSLSQSSSCVRPEFMSVHFDTGIEKESTIGTEKESGIGLDQEASKGQHRGLTYVLYNDEAINCCKYTQMDTKPVQLAAESDLAVIPLSPTLQGTPLTIREVDGEAPS